MRTYTLIETMKCIGLSKAISYVPIRFGFHTKSQYLRMKTIHFHVVSAENCVFDI